MIYAKANIILSKFSACKDGVQMSLFGAYFYISLFCALVITLQKARLFVTV